MHGTRKEVLAAKVSSKKVEEEWVVGYYALRNFYTQPYDVMEINFSKFKILGFFNSGKKLNKCAAT